MYRNAKKIYILGLRCRKLCSFSGKFLNFGKSASVKDLTNIMSDCGATSVSLKVGDGISRDTGGSMGTDKLDFSLAIQYWMLPIESTVSMEKLKFTWGNTKWDEIKTWDII